MSDLNQGYSATSEPGTGAQLDARATAGSSDPDASHLPAHQKLHRDTVARPLSGAASDPIRDPAANHSASDATGTYPGGGGL